MALIHCNFFSEVLDLMTAVYVVLPDPKRRSDGMVDQDLVHKSPVLYLLHGMSDDHTIWQRRTSIERYVANMDLAVVMPEVHRSHYTDMAQGYRYWTFISEELPTFIQAIFPISAERKDTFTAGLSMGGYGAFKLALTYPDRFAAAASLSGALNVAGVLQDKDPAWRKENRMIFGDLKKLPGSENDLFFLAEKTAQSPFAEIPLYAWCGTEDFLYQDNLLFRDHAISLGLNLTFEEGPGEHDWDAWDRQIQRVLAWLPLGKAATEIAMVTPAVVEEEVEPEKGKKKAKKKKGKSKGKAGKKK